MRRWFLISTIGAALAACAQSASTDAPAQLCSAMQATGRLAEPITEASGVAASRRTPGLFWVHNDGRRAELFALDSTGAVRGRVRIAGMHSVDFEDIAAARCGDSHCLFLGDIGDNLQARTDRAIYRIEEPLPGDTVTAPAVRFPFHLPGRSEDAEALAALPDGRVFLVTKGRGGPITVFAFPTPLTPGVNVELKPVLALSDGLVQLPDMVTGAGATPDGRFIAIRTYSAFQLFRPTRAGLEPVADGVQDISGLREPQGEGLDIRDDGTVWLVSERGLEAGRATISRVSCRLPAAPSDAEPK